MIKTEFITRDEHAYSIETEKLDVLSTDGRRTILSNHMAIMMPLLMGVVETEYNGKLDHYVIDDGVIFFEKNEASILSDRAVRCEEIDTEKAKAHIEKARKIISESDDEDDIYNAKMSLKWNECLLKARERYSTKR
ncbi:MAG: ATP synthase F1 subunit epsilon [Erysipelotrichaceae bacterium]|nr:ATP synthase F1 subunit epsilon [Erysipelotrichaceae bacterium]